MKTTTHFEFNCLCCNKRHGVTKIHHITDSEHLCPECRDLQPRGYLFRLMEAWMFKGGDVTNDLYINFH